MEEEFENRFIQKRDILLNRKIVDDRSKNKTKKSIRRLLGYWYVPVLILLFFVFTKRILMISMLLFMFISALLVSAYRSFVPFNLGIELISFYSIILSIAINPIMGAAFAITLVFISHIMYKNFCVFLLIKCMVYGGFCFLAPLFISAGIVTTGIIIAVLRNLIFMGITFFMNPRRVFADMPAAIINVFLSIWLFSRFETWISSFAGI